MRFSERYGYTEVRTAIQVESMDDRLRVSLWNVLHIGLFDRFSRELQGDGERTFILALWDFLGWPMDAVVKYNRDANLGVLRKYFFESNWARVYDIVERSVQTCPRRIKSGHPSLVDHFARVLAREVSGYRFIGEKLTPISSQEEIVAIEQALDASQPLRPVHAHLASALDLLADRQNPDYRNSIKESISAVESLCALITSDPKATLGKALTVIEHTTGLHGALKNAFSSIYGYTSDADGIRHKLLDEPTLDLEDAKFMLVSCSAFINYLLTKAGKANIALA